jgi:hypothetical protein
MECPNYVICFLDVKSYYAICFGDEKVQITLSALEMKSPNYVICVGDEKSKLRYLIWR